MTSIFDKITIRYLKKKYNLTKNEYNLYKLKQQGLEQNKDYITTLFVGSSHGELGINTNLIPHLGAYNLCIGSQDLYYSYELYKKYAKLPNLKNICVTFSVFSSGYELQKTINKRLAYYYKKVFDIDFKYSPEYGSLEKELNILDKNSKYFLPKGYSGYQETVSTFDFNIAIRDVKSHLKNAFRQNGQENYIKKFQELADKHGHNLSVIITPHSPTYRLYSEKCAKELGFDYNKIFEKLYKFDKEIKILNYFDNESFTDDDFFDWEHLLPSGALKFTNIIFKDIINK